MSDLFRVCLYFEEEMLKQLVKGAESFFYFLLSVRSDRYSFINYKILYNNKGNSQTGAYFIDAFLLSSATR